MKKTKKYIIPGGAGFVGKNLIRVMIDSQIPQKSITVIDKDPRGIAYIQKFYPQVECVLDDLAEKGVWIDSFKGKNFVIMLAAQIKDKNYEPFRRNNIYSTSNVIYAMKKHKISRILNFSSAAVISVRKDNYANTKKIAEDLVTESGLTYVSIRPSMMFGPLDDKNIGWLINFSKKFPIFPLAGSGKYPRQPIYIDDISKLVIKMIDQMDKGKLKNKIFSINGKVLPFKYICDTVVKKVGGLRTTMRFPVGIFKSGVRIYNKLSSNPEFTPDQVDSLICGDIFDQWEWWKDYDIDYTPFDKGVDNMMAFRPEVKS